MPKQPTTRYHVSGHRRSSGALAGLAHDGIGWGHDPAQGSFHGPALIKTPNAAARLFRTLTKGANR